MDVWGNKELIHRDRRLSVMYLMPLKARPRPPILQEATPSGQPYATAYVPNVYADMPDVARGTIKYLRIAQAMPWPSVRAEDKDRRFNDLHYAPAGAWTPVFGAWDWSPHRVIGTVPVEKDGSAYFRVPVDQPIYFQALDEDFLEVRRMRSNVTFKPGETRGCIGCHHTQEAVPSPTRHLTLQAVRRDPSLPEPPSWGDRIVPGFEQHIQPILDRHCVKCHGQASPAAGLEFTSRVVDSYMQSYRTIFGVKPSHPTPVASEDGWRWQHKEKRQVPFDRDTLKRMAKNEHAGQLVAIADRFGGAEVSQPLEFGSAKSKLILTLLGEKHRQRVGMSRQEWTDLVTWVDLNAPYLDTLADKDAVKTEGVARRVRVIFPDPWEAPPAGEWVWRDESTVEVKPS